MLTKNEDLIYNNVRALCGSLMSNQSQLTPYPYLQPIFVNLGAGLDTIFTDLLRLQREELLYGSTPWAAMYKMDTGRAIELPDNIIHNINPCDSWYSSVDYPIGDVLKYAVERDPTLEHQTEIVFEDDEKVVKINLKNCSAVITWHDNDMTLTFPTLGHSVAHAMCPLFKEPYKVDISIDYIKENIAGPLYKMLTGVNPCKRNGTKYILMDHFFTDPDGVRMTIPEDHVVAKLIHLFCESGYHTPSFVDVPFKQYTVRLRAMTDWDCYTEWNNTILVIERIVHTDSDDSKPYRDWDLNPLFVNDLLAAIQELLEEALEKGFD